MKRAKQTVVSIFCLLWSVAFGPSPHGSGFKINCGVCHNPEGWTLKIKTDSFNHNKTAFPLVGSHKTVSCKACHPTLKFREASTQCIACHNDIHQQTAGADCDRCHTPQSWLVKNIKPLHEQRGFPLVGAHGTADCRQCHQSASQYRFDNLNTECYTCHKTQYRATTSPNHAAAGYSTDCNLCHNMVGRSWSVTGKGFEHGFFPLVGGHNLACNACHTGQTVMQKINPDCKSCHASEYTRAISAFPAHLTKIAKFACNECHSANGWNSVRFKPHDGWFGIYSGNHKGAWDRCIDCHNNNSSYQTNCKRCHD